MILWLVLAALTAGVIAGLLPALFGGSATGEEAGERDFRQRIIPGKAERSRIKQALRKVFNAFFYPFLIGPCLVYSAARPMKGDTILLLARSKGQ